MIKIFITQHVYAQTIIFNVAMVMIILRIPLAFKLKFNEITSIAHYSE